MAQYVVLLGAPGAGKGTQAKLLAEALGLAHVATGDIFRENLKNETELGLLAKTFMDAGDLVPDEVTIKMVADRIGREDCAEGVIFDGFPRTAAQAGALDELLKEMGDSISIAPQINVSQDELVSRLLARAEQQGRADDNEETIRNRMRVYEEQTKPLLNHFDEMGVLVEVDGKRPIGEVFQSLIEVCKA